MLTARQGMVLGVHGRGLRGQTHILFTVVDVNECIQQRAGGGISYISLHVGVCCACSCPFSLTRLSSATHLGKSLNPVGTKSTGLYVSSWRWSGEWWQSANLLTISRDVRWLMREKGRGLLSLFSLVKCVTYDWSEGSSVSPFSPAVRLKINAIVIFSLIASVLCLQRASYSPPPSLSP